MKRNVTHFVYIIRKFSFSLKLSDIIFKRHTFMRAQTCRKSIELMIDKKSVDYIKNFKILFFRC